MQIATEILVVDDDLQVIRYVKAALESNGYTVKSTTSSRKALEMVEESRPDLLILDLNMPQPDGFEVLKAQRLRYPGLPILVISGHMDSSLLEAASILGATATLEKPVTCEVLVRTVREVVGR